MADKVRDVMTSAVRNALASQPGGLVSWRYEMVRVTPSDTQIKVWPEEGRPPRYFTVSVVENQ